ncbi:helix-turn-helix transcriptional regulator [Aquimarina megaterium]|uniref:helix-turn-helix transcriptional regulator n=1 Tax=Aquimarina megaterium TaxID=1443666 RepID=UPI0005564066|nr:WYL domain-containing protein [Aquimarina megaterium]
MNRVDRLMSMLWTLQSKKFVSAEAFAKKYRLSLRTVYRDIKALNEVGIPVYFEPGKGYCIMKGYFLPPLLFTIEEANSLLLLQSLAYKFADKSITKNSDTALEKIKAVLKYQDWEKLEQFSSKVEVYLPSDSNNQNHYLSAIQNAIVDKHILNINYTDNNNNQTQRAIEPIGIIFYNNQWHLIAWCSLREAYRDFIVSKINRLVRTSEDFKKEHSYTIQEYMKIF